MANLTKGAEATPLPGGDVKNWVLARSSWFVQSSLAAAGRTEAR
jgi:hypothetical protein